MSGLETSIHALHPGHSWFLVSFSRISWLCLLTVLAVTNIVWWPQPAIVSQWTAVWVLGACAYWSHYLSGAILLVGRSFLVFPLTAILVLLMVNCAFSFRPLATLEEGMRVLAGVSVIALVMQHVRSRKSLMKSLLVLGIMSSIVALHALGQRLGFDVLLWWPWKSQFGGGRPAGLLGNPILLGGHFAVLLQAGLVALVFGATPAMRITAGAFAYLAAILTLLSQSRAAWLAGASGLACMAWLLRRQFRLMAAKQVFLLAVWSVAVAVGVLGITFSDDTYADRVFLSKKGFVSQFANRIATLRATGLILRERPLLGIGGGCFHHGFAKHLAHIMLTDEHVHFSGSAGKVNPHCEYARILSEYGVFGFGLMVWLGVCCVKGLLSRDCGRRGPTDLALATCGVAYAVNALFNMPASSAIASLLFWFGIGLLVSDHDAVMGQRRWK